MIVVLESTCRITIILGSTWTISFNVRICVRYLLYVEEKGKDSTSVSSIIAESEEKETAGDGNGKVIGSDGTWRQWCISILALLCVVNQVVHYCVVSSGDTFDSVRDNLTNNLNGSYIIYSRTVVSRSRTLSWYDRPTLFCSLLLHGNNCQQFKQLTLTLHSNKTNSFLNATCSHGRLL